MNGGKQWFSACVFSFLFFSPNACSVTRISKDVIGQVDMTGSGRLGFGEFCTVMSRLKNDDAATMAELGKAFKVFFPTR